MGFKRRTYRLKFEDPTLDGLEVTTRGASVEEMASFSALTVLGEDLMQPERAEERQKLYRFLASKIIEWNLEDENGTPIPCTADALADEDVSVVLAIMFGWADAVAGISSPLGRTSSDGEPSPALSTLPTEVLSPSLLS